MNRPQKGNYWSICQMNNGAGARFNNKNPDEIIHLE